MFTSSYEPTENNHLDLQLHLLGRIASTLLFGSFPPISYVVFQIQQTQWPHVKQLGAKHKQAFSS